jgi:hypothetical protein
MAVQCQAPNVLDTFSNAAGDVKKDLRNFNFGPNSAVKPRRKEQ